MIEQFIGALRAIQIDFDSQEVAELLWLAQHLEGERLRPISEQKDRFLSHRSSSERVDPSLLPKERPQAESAVPIHRKGMSSVAGHKETMNLEEEDSGTDKGLPFRVPAPPALRNQLELGRALRPLMRKIPSRYHRVLDEEATAVRIAEEGMIIPVMRPAMERWLELELVIDVSPLCHLWQEIITDFQHLLEYSGAFRYVRTWRLESDNGGQLVLARGGFQVDKKLQGHRRPGNFSHSGAQKVVILVSDGLAARWWRGKITVIDLLREWSKKHPLSVFQLLPFHLWSQSSLGVGLPVQLAAPTAAASNTQLLIKRLPPGALTWLRQLGNQEHLNIPVTPLLPAEFLDWTQVTAGCGTAQMMGVVLTSASKARQEKRINESPQLSAEALVRRFFVTASPAAQRLVGLMAAVPVQMPVIYLLQQTLATESDHGHLAEIFMSGLLQPVDNQIEEISYDFVEGVRELLIAGMPTSQTEMVLETISQYIARRLFGRSVRNFQALLMNPQVWQSTEGAEALPFALVAKRVLQQMGGKYAEFAQGEFSRHLKSLEQPLDDLPMVTDSLAEMSGEVTTTPIAVEQLPPHFPELQSLSYLIGRLIDVNVWPVLESETFESFTLTPEPEETNRLQLFSFTVATLERQRRKWSVKYQDRQANLYLEPLSETITLEMVAIPGGEFTMGSHRSEKDREDDEGPRHQVTIAPFFLGRYPVTQAQWRVVAAFPQVERRLKPDPSSFKGDLHPVECVSWEDAIEFCARLSAHSGQAYRLPSEAEWEYACRAGTTTAFHFGDTISSEVANYGGTSTYNNGPKGEYRKITTPVNYFEVANAFGLSDMHGNVLEWCQDHWHDNYDGAPDDGSAWVNENDNRSRRVNRGGSWISYPVHCRSARRDRNDPGFSNGDLGFRVACSAPRS